MNNIMENYSNMYPELSEHGKQVTQKIIDKFKIQLEELTNKTLYEFTNNIADEIVDDDSWINVRQQTRNALCGYPTEGQYSSVNWTQVRKVILEENQEVIVNDIIKDKDKEIERLTSEIQWFQQNRF